MKGERPACRPDLPRKQETWGCNHQLLLVGGFNPSEKMMEFVNWDHEIPNIWESHKIPWFQTTNQSLFRTAKVVEKSVKHLETPPCPRPHLHSFPGRPKLNGPLRVLSRDKWGLAIQHQGHVVSGACIPTTLW